MIISHNHRFCFFAIPRTGSKAVSKALIEANYGEEKRPMHLSLAEFRATASQVEKGYYSFCTVRNPLDSVVSAYFKKKNDHNGRFSRGTFKSGRPIAAAALEEYRFIQENNADFADYFLRFYHSPWRLPRHENTIQQADRVMRYERLATDLAAVLVELSLPDVPLPVYNVTAGKAKDFTSYYPPRTRARARSVFQPLMESWGYAFPEDW